MPVQVLDGTAPWFGFVVAFSGPITVPSTEDAWHIFEVLIDPQQAADVVKGFRNPLPIAANAPGAGVQAQVIPVNVTSPSPLNAGDVITGATQISAATTQALALVIERGSLFEALLVAMRQSNAQLDTRVRLRGDFLLDTAVPPRAISADFVRADLPTGERPKGSGLCLEGGTFESWLTITQIPD